MNEERRVKQAGLALALAAAIGCASGPGLNEHVATLTSDPMEGRLTGTDGEKRAAAYIGERFRAAGLTPRERTFKGHGVEGRNVLAEVAGSVDETVVVGAHYDHLGVEGDRHYRGADDNASGTAVLLELSRRFASRPAKRAVVFAAFSGEELGLHGSMAYVRSPEAPLEKTVAMVNLDMVGRLRESLVVFGADTGSRFREYLADSPIRLAFNKDAVGPSDHTSFVLKGIPAIHLFTGSHADYHKPGDLPEKLNVEGMARVADLVETLVRRIADAPERMAFVKPAGQEPSTGQARKGAAPYFGVMPDYGFEGKGVRLSGVAPSSPADKAGLKEGDVLRVLNGREVEDVKAYSSVFFALKPGDAMTLEVERGGARSTVKAVVGLKNRSDE
jgi:hypothetical protein